MADILLKDKNGADVICENVKSVRFRTVDGGSVSFVEKQEFNIAYGDEPPEDTSKLWVKCDEVDGVIVLPITAENAVSQEGKLETIDETIPASLYDIPSAVVGTSVYLLGGSGNGPEKSNRIMKFDTESETLTTLDKTLAYGESNMGTAVVGTRIYMLGGAYSASGNYKSIRVFDTETEVLTTVNNFDVTIMSMAAEAVGKKIYVFGGFSASQRLASIMMYDTESNVLTTLKDVLPKGVNSLGSVAIGSIIYLLGGFTGNSRLTDIHAFSTNTETLIKNVGILPIGMSQIGVSAVGDTVYIFGGRGDSSSHNTIYAFNTKTYNMQTLDMILPENMCGIATETVGSNIYLFGGQGYYRSSAIFEFQAPIPIILTKNHLLITTNLSNTLIELLPNFTISVECVYKSNADNEGEKVEAYIYKDGAWTLI